MKQKSAVSRRSLCILAVVLLACGLLVYWEYVFGNKLFVFNDIGSDTMQQYVMHYQTIINHIREGNFSFWDFNNGFGTSMFQLNLFDPTLDFLYLTGILTGTEHLLYYLVYLQLFRIVMAGIACYIFLSCFDFGEKSKWISSFIYGLNGFMMVWGQHYQFGIVLTYLPFLLYFLECSLHTGKVYLRLSLMSCLMVIYSFYLGYMSFAASGIYLIFRLVYMEGINGKEKIILFFKRVGNMFLGIGMGAAALLPGAYIVFGVSARMEEERGILQRLQEAFTPYSLQYYKTLILKFFSGHLNGRNSEYNGYLNYYEDTNVFFGTLFFIVFIQYLFMLMSREYSGRKRAAGFGAVALSGLIFLLPIGGIAFNGFASYPTFRFTFAFMPFFALMTAEVLEQMLVRKKIRPAGLILSGIVIAGGYLWRLTAVHEKLFAVNVFALLSTGLCMIAVFWKYRTEKKRNTEKILYLILCGLVIVNMGCEAYVSADNRVTVEKNSDYFDRLYSEDIQDALTYLKETDPTFYRVEKDFESATYCMDALAQNYRGISTYNSTMNAGIQKMIETCFPELIMVNPAHIRFSQKAQDPVFAELCGIKYLLSENPALGRSEYHLIGSFGNIYLYQIETTEGFGKFYGNTTDEKGLLKQISEEDAAAVMNRVLFVEDSVPQEKNGSGKVEMRDTGNDSWLCGTVSCSTDGYVMLPVAAEGGWKLEVDGKNQELLTADYGFTAFSVKAGEHEFELKFAPPLLKEGLLISGICCSAALALFLAGFVKAKNNKNNAADNHKD